MTFGYTTGTWSCHVVGGHSTAFWTAAMTSGCPPSPAAQEAAPEALALDAVSALSGGEVMREPSYTATGVLAEPPERYELRYAVGHLYARDLRDQLGIPKTSRIVGASFQVGGVDGRGDAVVLLIERPAEGAL